MKHLAALLILCQALFATSPVLAQMSGAYGNTRTVNTQSWVEEWDPATGQWVRVDDETAAQTMAVAQAPTVTTTYLNGQLVSETRQAARYAQPRIVPGDGAVIARYGPFVVTNTKTAAMVGPTGSHTPAQFDAMLRDFPQISVLEMIEAPGTSNDIANLAVGRRIREAGIATHIPMGGSVRSGAVELFLAGAQRTMDESAQFAVHSWLDNQGREADDFADNHPAHRLYLDYYVEMGMSEAEARQFYAMTNSVPHHSALWLKASDMRQWLPRNAAPRSFAQRASLSRGQLAVAAARQPSLVPHSLPLIAVEFAPIPAIAPALAAAPALDYGNIGTLLIARLDQTHIDS